MTKRNITLALNILIVAGAVACIGFAYTSDNMLALCGWFVAAITGIGTIVSDYEAQAREEEDDR